MFLLTQPNVTDPEEAAWRAVQRWQIYRATLRCDWDYPVDHPAILRCDARIVKALERLEAEKLKNFDEEALESFYRSRRLNSLARMRGLN